jgi:hypothetical protein
MPRRWARMASASLDALDGPEVPATLRELPMVAALRRMWQRHYARSTETEEVEDTSAIAQPQVRNGYANIPRVNGAHRKDKCRPDV